MDGHHEKCLTLLWCLLLRYQVLALVDEVLLDEEIILLKSQLDTKDSAAIKQRTWDLENREGVPVHSKLLYWSALVGHMYGLRVSTVYLSIRCQFTTNLFHRENYSVHFFNAIFS